MEGFRIIDKVKSANIPGGYLKFYKTIIFFGLIFLGLSISSCAVSAVTPSTSITNNSSAIPGPIVSSASPAYNALNVPQNVTIKINFNQAVKFGTKYIQLKTSKGLSVPITTTITGKELIIKPDTPLTNGTNIYFNLA